MQQRIPLIGMPEKREPDAEEAVERETAEPGPYEGSATHDNVGPARSPIFDPEDIDDVVGTTSGTSLRGKPKRGSRERSDY